MVVMKVDCGVILDIGFVCSRVVFVVCWLNGRKMMLLMFLNCFRVLCICLCVLMFRGLWWMWLMIMMSGVGDVSCCSLVWLWRNLLMFSGFVVVIVMIRFVFCRIVEVVVCCWGLVRLYVSLLFVLKVLVILMIVLLI